MQCLTRSRSVQMIVDGEVPLEMRAHLSAPLWQALSRWGSPCSATVRVGRHPDEAVISLRVGTERPPMPLYLPAAARLQADEVLRIISNVLDGLGKNVA